jgi:hypothetical protein
MVARYSSRKWQAELGDDNNAHVIPLDDLQFHVLEIDCGCSPETETVANSESLVVTHNSYDRRELN